MLIIYIYLRFCCILPLIILWIFAKDPKTLGVNSRFVNMTWENPISFYCQIKVVVIMMMMIIIIIMMMIIIIIVGSPRPGNTALMSSEG